MINNKKAILILGAISAMNEIVIDAKKMGYYVVVADYLEDSPAKKFADETWLISIDDVDALVDKCIERGIDGVMNYCIDPGQKPYQQICERLNLPCVANFEQFDIMTNKDKFAKTCIEYGLDVIPKYNIDMDLNEQDYTGLVFPVMIKPVDGRASKGIIVANSAQEMPGAIEYSLKFSKRKKLIIEKFMQCPEFCAKYFACNGEIYFTSMSDVWDSVLPDGTRVYMGTSVYPSQFCKEYIEKVNDKVIAMIKGIGIKNGALSFTGFYDNGAFRFFDPSLRMGGAQDWRIVEAASGVNIANMLTNFAVSGNMGKNEEIRKLDKAFLNKFSALLYYDLKEGVITSFEGIDAVCELPGVVGYHKCHDVGDVINGYGTSNNVAIRFIISCDNYEEFKNTINIANSLVEINGTDGNSMVAPRYKPEYFWQHATTYINNL